MTVYSFSRLDMFEKCPRRHYFKYVESLPEPPSYAAEFGKAVHAVIAGVINKQGMPLELAKALVASSPLLTDDDVAEIEKMAGCFLASFNPQGEVLTEHKLVVDLGDGQSLLGYADLIEVGDGKITITDFKTGRTPYDALDTRQLPLYAWMAQQEFGASQVEVQLWWLREPPKRAVRKAVADDSVQQDAVGWALEMIGLIEEAEQLPGWAGFPEKPGTGCSYCPYVANCLQLAVPEGEGSAPDVAGLVLRLESLIDSLKELLKGEVEKNGPIEVGGEVFDFHPRSVWDYDVRAVVSYLDSIGEDPYEYLSVDGRKLKKLLSGDAGDVIRSLGKENVSKYFTHKAAEKGAA